MPDAQNADGVRVSESGGYYREMFHGHQMPTFHTAGRWFPEPYAAALVAVAEAARALSLHYSEDNTRVLVDALDLLDAARAAK
jgi:hypothetical protein